MASERAWLPVPSRPVPSQRGCLPRALGKATPTCADFFQDLLGHFAFFNMPQKNLGKVQYVIRFLSQPGQHKSISGKVLWAECFHFYSYKCRRELGKHLHGSQTELSLLRLVRVPTTDVASATPGRRALRVTPAPRPGSRPLHFPQALPLVPHS